MRNSPAGNWTNTIPMELVKRKKSEARRPKAERNPRTEIRRSQRPGQRRPNPDTSHEGEGRDAALRRPRAVQVRNGRFTKRSIRGTIAVELKKLTSKTEAVFSLSSDEGGGGAGRGALSCWISPLTARSSRGEGVHV